MVNIYLISPSDLTCTAMCSRKTSNILIPKILSHRISHKEKDVVSFYDRE